MRTVFRYGLLTTGLVMLILTVGFFWQLSWAVNLWPWPESRLSYIFLASITAAIAGSSIWTALSEEYGSLPGQAINTTLATAGLALTAFVLQPSNSGIGTLMLGLAALAFCAAGIVTYLAWRTYPIKDPRPMPVPVRVSFFIFAAVLILLGGAMVLGVQVFPWTLQAGSLIAYGFFFLGACTYFLYPALRPSWHNARAQLWGFLAYDLVLIIPFLGHFERVKPEFLPNLIIYIIVLIYSGALAIYYLFINPITRPANAPPPQSLPA